MWPEISYWLGFVAIGVLPGWALLEAAGMKWPRTELLAAAPGMSIAGVALFAYLAELVGLVVAPWSALVLLFGCAAALWAFRRRRAAAARPLEPSPSPEPWYYWLVFACPVVVFVLLQILRDLVILPPTVDDGVHHATWARLIFEKETLSPAAIYAPPVSDHRPVYYPWGLHAWIAVLARVVSLEWIETYWRSVLAIGSCVPLSVYVLATRVLPKGWPCLAAALCSLLFFWLPFQPYLWGGLSLLAGALCALPVARVALDAATARRTAPMVMAVGAGVGLLLVHPSQALGALLIAAIVAMALGVDGSLPWPIPALFVGALATVGLVFHVGPDHWEPLDAFMQRAVVVAQQKAAVSKSVLWWLAGLFLGHGRAAPILGALCGLGLVVAVVRPAFRPVLWIHLGLALLLPLALGRTWLTALWYHDLERLWYLQLAATPLLAAVGMWGVVDVIGRIPWRRLAPVRRPEILWPLALAVVAGGSHRYFARVPEQLAQAKGTMASDRSHLEDFAWIRENLPEDRLILNAPGDWGLVLPFTGRPITFANCQVSRSVAEHSRAFWGLHDVGSYDEKKLERLRALGVGYVYAAFFESLSVATARGRTWDEKALELSPALERVYESRTARIYRVRERVEASFPDVELSLGEDSPADFEGFHPVEHRDGRAIRWTTGRGTIDLPQGHLPARAGCHLVLGMRRPWHFPVDVTWDGRPLRVVVAGVYAMPEPHHVLEIRSPAFAPAELDPKSTDPRRLGVALRGLSLECKEGAGAPAHTVVVPLEGSDDARFHGFHALERDRDSSWRWTKALSRVHLRDTVLPTGKHCVVNLALETRWQGSIRVSWNGVQLVERTPGSFALGERLGGHRLVLSSKTQRHPDDSRVVGVGLWRVGMDCPEPAEP